MIRHAHIFLLVSIGAAMVATAAQAVPVRWELDAASSDAAVAGSFIYDADTNAFSDIDLEASSAFVGISDHPINVLSAVGSPTPTRWRFSDGSNESQIGNIFLSFILTNGGALTNAGGLITDAQLDIARCTSSNGARCTGSRISSIVSQISGHKFTLTGTPTEVPLPAAAWFFIAGLAGLGAMRKRAAKGAK